MITQKYTMEHSTKNTETDWSMPQEWVSTNLWEKVPFLDLKDMVFKPIGEDPTKDLIEGLIEDLTKEHAKELKTTQEIDPADYCTMPIPGTAHVCGTCKDANLPECITYGYLNDYLGHDEHYNEYYDTNCNVHCC